MSDSEKRIYRRIPDHVDMKYRIISLGENPENYIDLRGGGMSENISEGGMLFEVHEHIPLGSFLEVQLDVPEVSFPIYLRGKVVRVEELIENKSYDIGIHFTQYFQQDRELLNTHLKDLTDKIFADEQAGN